uniref:N-acetylglucosaminylphosphatidylinositol deacetylase n=1 Tax=Ditylenchus dipsaci TaxID=166011 RepID=A0A915EKP6_9BILA
MFFGPTIQNVNPKNLQEELKKAICQLGIPSEHLYFVDKEEKNFQDGFMHKWDIKLLSQSICQYLQRLNCQILITFDNYGVSGHPNHIACYQAVERIMDQWSQPILRLKYFYWRVFPFGENISLLWI